MLPKLFLGLSIYVGTMSFHFHNIYQWKIFHRHPQRHRHQSPTDFFRIGQSSEKYFFENLNINNKIWKIYIKQYIAPASFLIFLEILLFFCIFPDFLKIQILFSEKNTLPVSHFHRSHGVTFGHFRNFPIRTNIWF